MHVCAIVAAVLRPTVSCIAQLSLASQQRERERSKQQIIVNS